ncbi:MAG: M28 family metallopeptidase [Planctomycetota bacterium]|nr:M28 family metallopeptidase [Planctomycetota bacterium]
MLPSSARSSSEDTFFVGNPDTTASGEVNVSGVRLSDDVSFLGFTREGQDAFEPFEDHAVNVPQPSRARQWLHALTEEPHVAGTAQDYKTAIYVRDQLLEMGFSVEIAEYHVLLNYPKKVTARLIHPEEFKIPLRESGFPLDKDSYSETAFPAFHGYGASGKAEGQVIYANYGRVEDFDRLEDLGVAVEGRIILARYGKIFRGLKVKNAQQRGALGVLLYSDPADDGYMKGDIYPIGPFRPDSAIQRGSVQFLSLNPGDPSTPGWASVPGARHIEYSEISEMARIPSLPISYGAARPILKGLAGFEVPQGWQGGLPFAYHTGPGVSEIEIEVVMDYAIRPIWNVIATIKGTETPDRWVMIGNHRDAWTYGAVDPGSGTAAWLEAARAVSEAVKNGWKPRRSLVFASWDGEEYGLLGSTEWGEQFSEKIKEKVVFLINVDSAVAGLDLDLAGVPSLRDFMLQVAADEKDPRQGKSLRSLWVKAQQEKWATSGPVSLSRPEAIFVPQMRSIGSGSDYTVFLDHLGIPVLDVDFRGRYGVYHSLYDNFFWMEKFGDPGFIYHATAARLYTRLLMRASSSEILPFRFSAYGFALKEHLDELKRIIIRKRRLPEGHERLDWTSDFSTMDTVVERFFLTSQSLDRALDKVQGFSRLNRPSLGAINDALARLEQAFTDPTGLPGRDWFRHLIYAPGLTTGYASWPMPGMRQAIEQNRAELFARESLRIAERIQVASEAMEQIQTLLAALRE